MLISTRTGRNGFPGGSGGDAREDLHVVARRVREVAAPTAPAGVDRVRLLVVRIRPRLDALSQQPRVRRVEQLVVDEERVVLRRERLTVHVVERHAVVEL